jgi:hypothetical protein
MRELTRNGSGHFIFCFFLGLSIILTPGPTHAQAAAQDIARESTAPSSQTNHPLPLVASWQAGTQWNCNTALSGFTPD